MAFCLLNVWNFDIIYCSSSRFIFGKAFIIMLVMFDPANKPSLFDGESEIALVNILICTTSGVQFVNWKALRDLCQYQNWLSGQ